LLAFSSSCIAADRSGEFGCAAARGSDATRVDSTRSTDSGSSAADDTTRRPTTTHEITRNDDRTHAHTLPDAMQQATTVYTAQLATEVTRDDSVESDSGVLRLMEYELTATAQALYHSPMMYIKIAR
jgi:hypothetical protein